MDHPFLVLHHILPVSQVNGPGKRAVLWLQGCTLGCPGCYNPETHPTDLGQRIPIAKVLAEITRVMDQIEGITISGGEPFQQPAALLGLLEGIRENTQFSVLVFSGFSLAEIQRIPLGPSILSVIDVLIAGRFVQSLRLASGLRGSSNKAIHLLSDRYTLPEIESILPSEVLISADGEVTITGIDPLKW
jgi:anaerobic ribonucleoside-triphosphate reductase activating protein